MTTSAGDDAMADATCPARDKLRAPGPDRRHQRPRAADDLLADRPRLPSRHVRRWPRPALVPAGSPTWRSLSTSAQRYPFTFADRQATTRRDPLSAGDYGLIL